MVADDLPLPEGFERGVKLVSRLDPRPSDEAAATPFSDAVNIPLAELPGRMYELPPPGEVLCLPDLPVGRETAEFLAKRKRTTTLVPFTEGVSGTCRLWRPNPFLEEVVPQLTPGVALDVGCGAGRDAVFLASLGWRVLALDILPDALEQGRELAQRYLPELDAIEWRLADVRRTFPEGEFDLIVMFAFLNRPLLARAAELLHPGGSLVLETFTQQHRARHGRPASDDLAVEPEELPRIAPGLHVVQFDAKWRGERHTGRLWAKNPVE